MDQNSSREYLEDFFSNLPEGERDKIIANLLEAALARALGRLWEFLSRDKQEKLLAGATEPTDAFSYMQSNLPQERIKGEMDQALREVMSAYINRL